MDKYLKKFKTFTIITSSDLSYGEEDYDIDLIQNYQDLFSIIDKYAMKYNSYELKNIEFNIENETIYAKFER
jgi:hypothetical protein